MKTYIHSRLSADERRALDRLKAATGRSESELVRIGLRHVAEALARRPSALDLAGSIVGRFEGGPADLSTNRSHLDDFGR